MVYDVARVRGLFPALGDGWIHLDPQVGGQIPDTVATAVAKGFRSFVSAPTGQYPAAAHTATLVSAARSAIADLVGGDPAGVVLGPGRDHVLSVLAEALQSRVWLGSDVLVSKLDDDANITPWVRAADRVGARVKWAEVDIESGEVPTWQFDGLIESKASIFAITMASSTIGTVVDVPAAAAAIHAVGGLLVVDATSAAPYEFLDIGALGADIVVVAPSRWGGPQSAAAVFRDPDLIARLRQVSLNSSTIGPARLEVGEHQYAMLNGTIAAVEHLAGLDESARGTRRERLAVSMASLRQYHQKLLRYTLNALNVSPMVSVIGGAARRVPTVSFTVAGVSASKVVGRLADNGICAIADVPSRYFDGLGVTESGGAVTIGLGPYSTPYDVDQLVRALGSLG